MYCEMLNKYIHPSECVLCDTQAGLIDASWTECTYRLENHPIRDGLRWWLRPRAFTFKLLLAMRWIVRLLSPRSRITIWANRDGWHFGAISLKPLKLGADS